VWGFETDFLLDFNEPFDLGLGFWLLLLLVLLLFFGSFGLGFVAILESSCVKSIVTIADMLQLKNKSAHH